MIHTRGEQSSDAEIVWAQLLQGIGSAFASTASQVGVQASVPHVDVATITAVVCLWSGIGGACGNAIGEIILLRLHRTHSDGLYSGSHLDRDDAHKTR